MLEVAGRLFAEGGYKATSMDGIAAGVGVTKPMLYAYFGSKQGLYLAYIRQAAEGLFERLLSAAPPELPVERRLVLGLEAFLAFVDERRDGWTVLFQQTAAQDAPLASEVAARRERLAAVATRMLRDIARQRGTRRSDRDLDALGHALVGAAESLANWWLSHPEVPRSAVLRALLDLTGLSLSSDPPPGPAGRRA